MHNTSQIKGMTAQAPRRKMSGHFPSLFYPYLGRGVGRAAVGDPREQGAYGGDHRGDARAVNSKEGLLCVLGRHAGPVCVRVC